MEKQPNYYQAQKDAIELREFEEQLARDAENRLIEEIENYNYINTEDYL